MNENIQFILPKRPLIWPDIVYDLQDMIGDQEVYIVGGAVRDAYLHRPVKDLDLITRESATNLARTIADHFEGDVYVMDAERDVARVLLETMQGDLQIDVATFRGESLQADLEDRDFTINAMAVKLNGNLAEVVDPLNGLDDLDNRLIRQCSEQAIANDPIRCLRAVRISTQLNARIVPETVQAIRQHSSKLPDVSLERLRDALFSILGLQRSSGALRVARVLGLLEFVLPHVDDLSDDEWKKILGNLDKLTAIMNALGPNRTDLMTNVFDIGAVVVSLNRYRHHINQHLDTAFTDERHVSELLALALILRGMLDVLPVDKPASWVERVGVGLRLSNNEIKYLSKVVTHEFQPLFQHVPGFELALIDVHRFWHKLQVREAGVSVGLLILARYLGSVSNFIDQDDWLRLVERVRIIFEAYFERFDEIVAPEPVIDGATLQSVLKLKRGPLIGKLLTAIREAQVTGEIFTQDDAIHFAQKQINEVD